MIERCIYCGAQEASTVHHVDSPNKEIANYAHPFVAKPEVVCFCGSSQFLGQMAAAMWECEKLGTIAMGLHLLPEWYPGIQADHQAEAEGIAEVMDELHLRKIDLADRVFVMNVGGYIGDSCRREIDYATSLGKRVDYLEEVSP